MQARSEQHSQPVPERRKRLIILGICSMSLLIVGLDSTIVNVALPAINRSFHSSLSGLQWVIDAYTLVLASLLMLSGSSADRIGRRRVFQIGLVLFSLGSLLCALAPSLEALVAARVLQAIGGSMLNPVAMSIIRNVFVDPRERARAIGIWGAVVGISMALGPVVGGALVDSISWRSVFIVNVPIGLLAIALTALFVPESKAAHPRRIDPVGQVIVIIALATLTYAIIEAPSAGWASAQTLSLFGVSLAAFVALVFYELRRRQPLLEMRFFRSAPFAGASAIAVALFAAMGGFLFLNTLYLQEVRGLSPFQAGLYTLPMAGLMMIMAPLSGRIVGNRGTRLPLVAGGIALVASGLILTQLNPHTPIGLLFVSYVLFGIGSGAINPPITNTAVSGMPPSQAGVAAAVASTSRQVGQTLGVAVLGALAGSAASGAIGPGFTAATHVSWWIVVALGVVILVLGFVTTTAWADATAGRTAELFRDDDLDGADTGSDQPELVAG
ncbi:MAG TPA: DHA2 family efflux MFS transporter permease subunit [Solirubrobacteraceae bacterium]|nr:DHA2 family efflux MFS transporter permease subunit [Solirubrobacteraceae bacterium]